MAVANRKKSSFLLLIIIAAVVLCPLTHIDCHENIHKEVAVFVFGDSFFDPGNNNYINTIPVFQANYLPYGESYFSPPTGRFSDGRLISDFIAEYARLPLIPPYLEPGNNAFKYGANFASSGAGALIETAAGLVIDLQTQLQYLGDVENLYRQNLGDTKAEQLLSNAVYLFSCGANDYISHIANNLSISSIIYPTLTNEQYTELVIGNLTNIIKGIYKKGGRKFGFLTVPLIGCFPALRIGQPGNTCNKEMNDIVRLHNQKLARKLEHMEKQLEGFLYAKFDMSTAITNRMNNPSKYGFKEGETACCGSGPFRGIFSCGGRRGIPDYELCDNATEFLFFDSLHPNQMADRQFAELFWQAVLKSESKKVDKHEAACLENQHVFVPFAFDTFGALAPQAIKLLDRVKKVGQSNSPAAKGQCFIFNRVGFAIQKGVAAQLVARLPSSHSCFDCREAIIEVPWWKP